MRLVGQTVKLENPDLLQFFYPGFVVRESLSILDQERDVIYTGRVRSGIKEYLEKGSRNYISLSGRPDYDLSTPRALVEFVFAEKGKTLRDSVISVVESLDMQDVEYACKIMWVTGVFPYGKQESETTLYDLFRSTTSNLKELLQVYLELLDQYPFYLIESSLLTFLLRSQDIDDQDISPHYKRLLKSFAAKSGAKMKPALFRYATEKGLRDDLRLLQFLLDLR